MSIAPASSGTSMTAGSLGAAVSQGLATDSRSMDALKSAASKDPKGAVKETARQFEALFMQELMKSMRQATMKSDLMENSGTQMGTEMLDTQFANKMTGIKGGLGEAIARQLEKQMSGIVSSVGSAVKNVTPGGHDTGSLKASPTQSEFIDRNSDAAKAAELQSGIPASFMLGQAAHESGWGKRDIRNADGSSSNNLFAIKAGPDWKGAVASVTTTEYIDGSPRKVVAKFRSYDSPQESFADYARLMKDNPRYSNVVAHAGSVEGFARGLQRAGYATDPAYADKLTRVINTTLRIQRFSA